MTGTTAERPQRLELDGELTIVTAADRYPRILSFVDDGPALEIDLSRVTDLDTAGLQLLLMARREAERRGATLRLREPSGAVSEVLAIAHLDSDLRAHDSQEA